MVKILNNISLLFGSTTASMASLNRLMQAVEKSRANSTGKQPISRALPGSSGSFADYMKPYGCWCNFDNDSDLVARGTPIDAWDKLCKSLSESYDCVAMDAAARGEECDPWNQEYSLDEYSAKESSYKMHYGEDPFAWSFTPPEEVKEFGVTDPLWMCKNIDSKCKTEVCIAEYWFVMEAWRLAFEQVADFHTAGESDLEAVLTPDAFIEDGFDRTENCGPVNSGKGNGNPNRAPKDSSGLPRKACCGNWPRRHSYKTTNSAGNTRGCCETVENARDFMNDWYDVGAGKTYDSTFTKCCGDGSLVGIGSDC